jgi:hypothetical protein
MLFGRKIFRPYGRPAQLNPQLIAYARGLLWKKTGIGTLNLKPEPFCCGQELCSSDFFSIRCFFRRKEHVLRHG